MPRDTIVVGAGLAGVTAALELQGLSRETLLLGPDVATVPIGIAHPFAGRSVDIDNHRMDAFGHALRWWETHDPEQRFHVTSQVRRAAPQGQRLHRSWERVGESLPTWLDHSWDGEQLIYGPGLTVRLDDFLDVTRKRLVRDPTRLTSFESNPDQVSVTLDDGRTLTTRTLILCVGGAITRWLDATFDITQGELAWFEAQSPEIRIGAGAHSSAEIEMGEGTFVGLGSTYIRDEQDPEALRGQLLAKGEPLTTIPQNVNWYRGTRVTLLPSRRPKVMRLASNVFALVGLGSKGLAWAPWLAQVLVRDHLPPTQ